jgi:UDP-glucose 4-epimerase
MSNYLVTGGAGFIGANVVRWLLKDGHQVRVLDNLTTGFMSNLESLDEQVEFIEGDICDLPTVETACRGVDYIIHLAAWRAVGRSVDFPLKAHDINTTGTLNVLCAAREANIKKVIFISSSAVYGNNVSGRSKESDLLCPESPYAVAKLTGEHYCRVFSQLYGLPTVSLRLFNVYGPYSRAEAMYSLVVPIWLDSLLNHKVPVIDWHGKQSRDFVHVNDVGSAITSAIASSLVQGEVLNIGSGSTISMNDLMDMLQELLGVSVQVEYGAKREGDVLMTCADIAKAKQQLGFEPTVLLREGLKTSLSWYKKNLERAVV